MAIVHDTYARSFKWQSGCFNPSQSNFSPISSILLLIRISLVRLRVELRTWARGSQQAAEREYSESLEGWGRQGGCYLWQQGVPLTLKSQGPWEGQGQADTYTRFSIIPFVCCRPSQRCCTPVSPKTLANTNSSFKAWLTCKKEESSTQLASVKWQVLKLSREKEKKNQPLSSFWLPGNVLPICPLS